MVPEKKKHHSPETSSQLGSLKFFVVLKTKERNASNSFFISRNHRAMTIELKCQSVNNFQKSLLLCLCVSFNTAVGSKVYIL
jgi:hypothetical protein